MSSLTEKFARQAEFIHHIGWANYLRFRLSPKGSRHSFRVCDTDVTVRKGTPDLTVAITSLSGEFTALAHLFPSDYKGVIIDAGGYIGTAAIALSRLYPQAQVVTIEPSAENAEILSANIATFPNIRHVSGALVPQSSGTISLRNRGTGTWGFSVVENPDDCPDAQVVSEVDAVSLSTLGVDLSDVGIMKLDIEGGEHALFAHDADALNQIDALIVELHDRIVQGCSEAFFAFSKDRIVIKDAGEKYLSVKR
ncbi:FkbM family methyltransferase [Shimia abyssi]|uniref:FkbM family methyltransferase n=1 Tax=Shimia abyssi TaxID=1662395 RepID=A0A2P8F6L7_9RHOB|nr:FkbM family methyltransferase [Shimia abyssi]PSL17364.1 FkbM family methyltransferase [Shimia abyssi]